MTRKRIRVSSSCVLIYQSVGVKEVNEEARCQRSVRFTPVITIDGVL